MKAIILAGLMLAPITAGARTWTESFDAAETKGQCETVQFKMESKCDTNAGITRGNQDQAVVRSCKREARSLGVACVERVQDETAAPKDRPPELHVSCSGSIASDIYVWFAVDEEGYIKHAEACGPTVAGPVQRCVATGNSDGDGRVHWKLSSASDGTEGDVYIDWKALTWEQRTFEHIEKNYVNLPKSTYRQVNNTSGRCRIMRDKRRIQK